MKLKRTSLAWAMKHVARDGDTDLFPMPFEFRVMKKQWSTLAPELAKIDIDNHSWSGPRRLIVPKSEFAFRSVSQLDPIDAILFAAIVKEIGRRIEKRRISPDQEVVFSYRFAPTSAGQLYSSNTGWEDFWKVSARHCSTFDQVLVTDLSDYYNQIYHHTVENQLDLCGIDSAYWRSLKSLLANVTEGVSRGVPIGPHPAHLIAEMSMIPVDQYLLSQGVTFCRYVDDIHIFCDTKKTDPHAILYKLVDYLDRTQKIQINKQKTKIFSSSEFIEICNRNTVDKPINAAEQHILQVIRGATNGPYQKVGVATLATADLAMLSDDKIRSVFEAYLNADEVDYVRLRWFIRRLAQVGVPGGVEYVVENFERLLPAISEVGKYLEAATDHYNGNWRDIGGALIDLYEKNIVQASEYLRIVILSLFTRIDDLNHISRLISVYDQSSAMCQRKIVLAAASAKQAAWLSNLKGAYKNADPWLRRAIIYALRVLPKDEKKFWLKSVKKRVDLLEGLVVKRIE